MGSGLDERVMRAVANEVRRRIIDRLYTGPASYTELMEAAGLGVGESGRFAYHLKRILNAGLVRQLSDGRYGLTKLGMRVAALLRQESSEVEGDIVESLKEFGEREEVGELIKGSALVNAGLSLIILGAVFLAEALLGIPATLTIGGRVYAALPNPFAALAMLMAGIPLMLAGKGLVESSADASGILQVLATVKYAPLLASRSGLLGRLYLLYALTALGVVCAVALAFII